MNLNLWPFTFKTAHDRVFRADVQPRSEVDEFKNRAMVFDSGRNRAMPDGGLACRHDDPFAGDETESDGRAIFRFSSQLLPGQPQTISIPAAVSIQRASLWIRRVAERAELEAAAALPN